MCVTAVTVFALKNLSSPSRAREFAAERGDLEASDTMKHGQEAYFRNVMIQ